ncbi:hypothetical protein [Cyanobium sp. CH-040]|uniref:hypothetical protein n=1 Tax=Cyanobium sp. CH-040 TaxID=2823708 RepID=UPI0020CF3499|nr:hypothetical protein [Cyanobium sp. CH-040]MCP9927757.1 hypothetical protein [Cyanobium sp. CH-040]
MSDPIRYLKCGKRLFDEQDENPIRKPLQKLFDKLIEYQVASTGGQPSEIKVRQTDLEIKRRKLGMKVGADLITEGGETYGLVFFAVFEGKALRKANKATDFLVDEAEARTRILPTDGGSSIDADFQVAMTTPLSTCQEIFKGRIQSMISKVDLQNSAITDAFQSNFLDYLNNQI